MEQQAVHGCHMAPYERGGINKNVCQIKPKFIQHQLNARLSTNIISLNYFIAIYCSIYYYCFTSAKMKKWRFREVKITA